MKRDKPPFEYCKKCGTPQIAEAHELILYFPSAEDAREAAKALEQALPQSFTAYDTKGEIK